MYRIAAIILAIASVGCSDKRKSVVSSSEASVSEVSKGKTNSRIFEEREVIVFFEKERNRKDVEGRFGKPNSVRSLPNKHFSYRYVFDNYYEPDLSQGDVFCAMKVRFDSEGLVTGWEPISKY